MEFREFIRHLEEKGQITHIERQVDPVYEVSTLIKKLDGRPLLFENVKGHSMQVISNICATRDLVCEGLGIPRKELIVRLAEAMDNPRPPAVEEASGYRDIGPDLTKLPILTYYAVDGGPYVASGIAIAADREFGLNASYHRSMMFKGGDGKLLKDRFVLRILQRDLDAYIERGLKEFAFCIGNSIPVLLGAAISVPIAVDEMAIANALAETRLVRLGGHTVPKSDIVMMMELTGEMHKEGPFVDLTETVDIVREQRVARVKNIFVQKDAVFHALLPGGLEHKVLMGMPREPTIYREVGKVCRVKDVLVTPGGASWLHGVVSIVKKNPDDGMKAIDAAFKGHRSMKHVFIVDDDIDVNDPHEVEWAMATRFQGKRGIRMFEDKGSSLDPSSDMRTQMTTKMGFDLTIPPDEPSEKGARKEFRKPPLPIKLNVDDYLRSCK
ncbi:MAG: UbiD family decarboxylase [Euryarchaeota archaeon]|nr:UbiD family decarboxylase [Euryarchaeota archaeon]